MRPAWPLCIGLLFAYAGAAFALPGEVLSEQKVSDTAGGFGGVLNDDYELRAVASLGDLDGDGVPDLAVGSRRDDDGGTDRGAVWILFLNADGTVKTEQKISDLAGGFAGMLDDNDHFGIAVEALGDLDGDGIADLAVGAFRDDDGGTNYGAVWILFLDTDGTVQGHQKISETQGGFAGGLGTGDLFGGGLARLGDLDRDGVTELAVSAVDDDDGGGNRGAAYVLFLLPDGTVHHTQKISDTEGGFTGTLGDDDGFSGTVAPLGDLDGDGVADLAVGALGDDDGGSDRGAVWVLLLEHSGEVKSHQKISDTQGGFTGALDDGDLFGTLASVGDGDGDGVADLAVGALADDDGGTDRGALWVLFLDTDGTVQGHQKLSATAGGFSGVLDDGDAFGTTLSGLGDLDGDGRGELAVGTPFGDDGGNNRGAVWVLFLDGSPLVCGDAVLDPGEACDDGGTADFDGCNVSCEIEDDLELFGVAGATGVLSAGVDGVNLNVSVTTGDAPTLLAQLLAAAINGNPTLMALGTTAQAVGNRVVTTGSFDTAQSTAMDTSVSVDPGRVVGHQKISDTQGGFSGALDDSDLFGNSAAALGDLDGDGVGDLAVGALFDGDGGVGRGSVWILFLDADGTVKSHQKISDTQGGFTGALDDVDLFGASAAALGDLDGDGIGDLGVGAERDDDGGTNRGAAWILFLHADGTVKSHQKISDTQGAFTGVLDDFDQFGTSAAALGDLDGDGIGDLAVGAHDDGDGGTNRGAVWILFLDADGTVKSHQKISDTQGAFTGVLDDFDLFGTSAAALGDLDGDGVEDLAVGAADDDGGTNRGAVWILFLDADGTVKSHQKISDTQGGFTGALEDDDLFGTSAAALGDLDGDGIGDLAVGADDDGDGGTKRGAVWILFLDADGTVKSHQKISDTQGGFTGALDDADLFGTSAAALGDLDGDGMGDLAVGAERDGDGGASRGAVWILSLDGSTLAHCGDTVIVLAETCDDGNTTIGDGCYATCELEDEIELFGTAHGGTLQAVVSGEGVLIATSAGQSAATVATNLSDAINLVPNLQDLDISSVSIAARVVTNGSFDDLVVMDGGIVLPEPGVAVMLGWGLLALLVLNARRQRRRLAERARRSGLRTALMDGVGMGRFGKTGLTPWPPR